MECEFLVYCTYRPETTENAAKIARAKLPGQSNNFIPSSLGIAQLVANNYCGTSSSCSEDGGADVIPVLFNTSLLMQPGSFGRFNGGDCRGRG
jgi:hypothetical protein